MKRVAKILLTLSALIAVVKAVLLSVSIFFLGLIGYGGGLGLGLAGLIQYINYTNGAYEYISQSTIDSFMYMAVSGAALIVAATIRIIIVSLLSTLFTFVASIAFINMGALEDKKVGYILSIVFGVFALMGGCGWCFLFMVLAGIFGLIALAKEKKKAKLAKEEQ